MNRSETTGNEAAFIELLSKIPPELVERMVVAAERIAAVLPQLMQQHAPMPPKEGKQVRAIRLLAQHGPDNLAEIAKTVGVNRRTLYRWPTFMEAVERQRAAAVWSRRIPRSTNREGVLL